MNPSLAVVCDYREEGWQSMDLCSQMLLTHLQMECADTLQAQPICPPFHWRLSKLPGLHHRRGAYNGDRLLNRFWDYPQYLRQRSHQFQLFHIADHTYAQLVHELPAERTGVFCHDIDAFRSLVEPIHHRRPAWFRAMSDRILKGLQKAAIVFYSTHAVRAEIDSHNLVDGAKLVHAPYGIGVEFSAEPLPLNSLDQEILSPLQNAPFMLHVGSCIDRKRVDVLLDVVAGVRKHYPDLRLVKVGGEWTAHHKAQIARLNLDQAIIHLHKLPRSTIAELYRRAAVVLVPSEAEGFGLPVVESLACGAIAIVSDIPVFREVGGAGVVYCPVADRPMWVETVSRLLANPQEAPALTVRLQRAKPYSWSTHAQIVANAYLQLGIGETIKP